MTASSQRLARWFYPYGSTRRVLRGPVRGFRIIVEPGIGLSYIAGMDAAAPRFFEHVLRPGMTVVDVGANKGQMTLLFAALVGARGRVAAIEAAPLEYQSLVRNVQLNRLGHVRTFHAAAADRSGTLEFVYAPGHPTQGKLVDVEPTYAPAGDERLTVPSMPLDDLLHEGWRPDAMKIDVEGAARLVLRGSRRLIAECSPKIYIELHGPEEQDAVKTELLARGYVAETIDGARVPEPTAASCSLWCYRPQ